MKTSFLKRRIIDEIVNCWNPQMMVIGGKVDLKNRTMELIYGDFKVVKVPFSVCRPSGSGRNLNRPDFRGFKISDYGHTICLGRNYEAGVDAFRIYKPDPRNSKAGAAAYRRYTRRQRSKGL